MTRKLLAIVLIVFVCAFAMGAAIHESIYRTMDKRVVTEVYVVKSGDTLWDIAAHYAGKDCRNIYVPEYKLEIEKQNPFLLERRGLIQPGDRITIEYIELDQ